MAVKAALAAGAVVALLLPVILEPISATRAGYCLIVGLVLLSLSMAEPKP